MAAKNRQPSSSPVSPSWPLVGPPCQCLAEFFREEFRKHHACLESYREYYSERAIRNAEAALARVLQRLEELCLRDDACELVGQLLRQFDAVTQLSSFSEPKNFH